MYIHVHICTTCTTCSPDMEKVFELQIQILFQLQNTNTIYYIVKNNYKYFHPIHILWFSLIYYKYNQLYST